MAKTKRYVRILKAGNPRYWYVNKIGRMFEFEREGNFTYKIREEDGHLAAIRKSDAEILVTEKRPASRNDRILITNADTLLGLYKKGDELVVDAECTLGSGVFAYDEYDIHRLCCYYVAQHEYEVIVNNEVKNEEADELENVEKRYDTAVETARDAIEELRLAAYAKGYEDAKRALIAQAPVEKTAQERRDEIVEQAKADVERLTARGLDGSQAGGFRGSYTYRSTYYVVKFNVNRNKRAVTAIVRASDYTGKNLSDAEIGIAKAAPDDCFNEHIGKAIALHRALGLEVPDEYLNAPQPTEVREGDVVRSTVDKSKKYVIAKGEKAWHEGMAGLSSMVAKYGRIIDDSRTEVGE
ncbi:hypothetical protein P8884_22665 [Bacillus haynesii]|nr:hypothetical protein [Bacillus haynesii]